MARRHHYKRRTEQHSELDVTTFLNLMVVLVPFLLITAVFSRLSIVELNLPSSSNASSSRDVPFTVEVIVRESGVEITNGTSVIASVPNVDGKYDWQTLSDHMISLKREYPDHESASVLLEPQIHYDYLIQAMDVVRSVELPAENGEDFELYALFAQISVGDAP
jgi:biopolymer transport protein ExbD